MQIVDKVLSKTHPLKAGEVKLIDGKKAMCITPKAAYGGGFGPLWAIEDMACQFTTASHYGYLEGTCRQVLPIERCIVIEITKGSTWGHYSTGTWMKFHAADLPPPCRTKVMEQSPLISENSGYETIQIYR
jgi:hypothetical protein